MSLNFQQSRQYLQDFNFGELFIEILGWSRPTSQKTVAMEVTGETFERRMVAELSGVTVFEITAASGQIPNAKIRAQLHKEISELTLENLLIFVDRDRTRSLWYWVKREGTKRYPREHIYVKGQPGDLFLGKISALVVDFAELEDDLPSVVDVAQKLQRGLDVERVTKKFFDDFKRNLAEFMPQIQGIDHENDRRWYASVILNRLMFVYFLQRKQFIDGNEWYLQNKLEATEQSNQNFYRDFLLPLFFEGFATPEDARSKAVKALIGKVKYLNGGLFLKHKLEKDYPRITIANEAFEAIFKLFQGYSWNLDDTPGGRDDEINPSVLGYIFEKYINQKEFGAYYTCPEITEYLCDRTINQLILDKVNTHSKQVKGKGQKFESIGELLLKLDADLCVQLIDDILPSLSLLDPACGSGAFLVAAMKTLINVYSAVIGRIKFLTDRTLTKWLEKIEQDHPSLNYYIKKRIITDNLYGVDIMEEAVEIAKLRLFLALVASAQKPEDLEPLPNIDFNIMAGNSLIGLIRVDEEGFDTIESKQNGKGKKEQVLQGNLLQTDTANFYRAILEEKNRSVKLYKQKAFVSGKVEDETLNETQLEMLKTSIDELNRKAQKKLNLLLLREFSDGLGIKYEEAQITGKPKKRDLRLEDIEKLEPFHWGYHFDQIIGKHGGFDAIITNPPWEIFKPSLMDFIEKRDELATRNKKEQEKLLKKPEVNAEWLRYRSQFPHVNIYYRTAQNYKNQISIIDGKRSKTTDINLYKLFLEQCFNLLHSGGHCGIVIPSGIYTDLGSKQLRELLFTQSRITGLFGFENRRVIFEGVDSRFKFVILSFTKGGFTEEFPVAFMRHSVKDLESFPKESNLLLPVELIRKLSPDALSIVELKNELDIQIVKKMLKFPLLGEHISEKWNISLGRELHMTDDSPIFRDKNSPGAMPLFEGKMIHQFTHLLSKPRYWINEEQGRKALLKKNEEDYGQTLNYEKYRLGFRDVARNTDIRTMITTVIPAKVFTGNTITVSKNDLSDSLLLYICSIFNSFIYDFLIRQKVTAHCSIFYVYQVPVPRLDKSDHYFEEIAERAAKLICTTSEFDALAKEVGLVSHRRGVTNEVERARLRAELDGVIAHLYKLTEEEFAHVLSTFPIVSEPVKIAALNAYRDVERGLIK
jgi:Alw26I/Eco31I/Esp3I family type II restriction m6 adenine DNA methyltransferase